MINEINTNVTSIYKSVENTIAKINTKQLRVSNSEEIFKDEDNSLDSIFEIFSDTSTRSFLNYVSPSYIKKIASEDLFFSNTHNLKSTIVHNDSIVKFEKMNQYEIDDHFKNLSINYSYCESIFGKLIIASTNKGICYIAFNDSKNNAVLNLRCYFKNASFIDSTDEFQKNALLVFQKEVKNVSEITLHINGTNFQIEVWQNLLKIPIGNLTTYGVIASIVNKPKAARAIGTAIGSNPIAFLIPCHRVIQTSGKMGGYAWGINRKTAIIGWEISLINSNKCIF